MSDELQTEQTEEATQEAAPEVNPEVAALQAKLERLAPLERYVDALGDPNALIELATYGHQVRNNSAVQDFISRGGKAPEAEEAKEDEFYDPEVKAVDAKYSQRLAELERTNSELRQRLDSTEVTTLKSTLTSNVETALGRFKDDPESLEQAKKDIQDTVSKLERAAAGGDANAISQLRSLGAQGGTTLLKMMTTELFEKSVEKRLAAASKRTDNTGLLDKATDGKTTTRPPLPSPTVSVKSGVKVTAQMTRDVLEQVTRNFGKDPKTIW